PPRYDPPVRLTRPLATVLLLLPLAAAPACRHAPSADPAATSRGVSVGASGGISGGASGDARDLAWTRSELYFGLRRPDDGHRRARLADLPRPRHHPALPRRVHRARRPGSVPRRPWHDPPRAVQAADRPHPRGRRGGDGRR